MKKPYVGITGFMDKKEALDVLRIVPLNPSRLIMVGILASSKTIQGIPNKWPNRFPAAHKIADVFPDDPRVINLIHYHTENRDTLYDQLLKATRLGGENLHGLQLNIAWPEPDIIEAYGKVYPEKQIVLQIGGHAFEMIDDSPRKLSEKVAEYEGLINYALLDPSGGHGRPFDSERTREYLYALAKKNPNIGLGVAGGLCPATLHILRPLIKEFPNLSIDAEGLLRTVEDSLDLMKCRDYLRLSLLMFP